MKKIVNILFLALSFTLITTACDEGFDELNRSKSGAISLDPVFILNNAIIASSPNNSLVYEEAIVQQWFSTNTGVLEGGNFNTVNVNNTPLNWNNFYQNVIKYTNDVIVRTKSDANRANLYNMARIIQANAFMIITDTYGDIPYTEAGGGYTTQNFFPKYETQQSIYPKIIDELTQAVAALGVAGKVETGDALFAGNVVKWKKFGNSLLLRAGMRLTKADPAKALATVTAAIGGNVANNLIVVNADNAIIRHDANFVNGFGNTVNGGEAANFYLAQPFVDALKGTVGNVGNTTVIDPRLAAIAIRYGGARSGGDQTANGFANGSKNPADQFGTPIGSTDGEADISGATLPPGGMYGTPAAPRTGNRFCYSQVDRNRMVKRTSPLFLVSAAQTNLLLAEAAMRGFSGLTFADAATYFKAGIITHMDQMELFDPGSKVATADRDTYVNGAEGTLLNGSLATALPQIGYQYWVASFLSGHEAWASLRRINYPALAPNPNPGSQVPGAFIQRLPYPDAEKIVNTANVTNAISTLGGPDALGTKVWWAK
ncbi:MAG: SusD/RagB family nutrient-binding outer membrane lipoprotein [Cyclobacteriaceae bacterium]|nr:SusD/RagB family nutrient-binding outer membrane lipoprotein [Cyclobacteriaceae bacterium]